MERDDDILEEDYVLITKGHSKARDDASLDIEKLRRAVEFVNFMNQCVEALVDGLADHLATGYQLNRRSRDEKFCT